jgi:hypothetical protein
VRVNTGRLIRIEMRERCPSPLLYSARFRLAFRGERGRETLPEGDLRYIGRETEENIDRR